ncbi:MAG: Methyltranfer dom protein [Candidatus Levybacteria bacterium]|nr:Methyltranfer dom protein [Candidatus Levybacteria bacterium]
MGLWYSIVDKLSTMFKELIYKISGERISMENSFLPPFFYQQQKSYSYCLKFIEGKSVLEVGSGSGYGCYRLSKVAKNILGVDNSEIAIKKSREKYKANNLEYICSKIENYTNEDKFDVILALQVLEHVKQPRIFLKKITSLMKKNGLLLITTPNKDTQSYNENPYHYKEYSFAELSQILLRHFEYVQLYGLSGDSKVKNFEKIRRTHVLNILSVDRFKLRRFIPRNIKQLSFDLISYFNRILYQQENNNLNKEILENNYKIVRGNKINAIDIIAVCKNFK